MLTVNRRSAHNAPVDRRTARLAADWLAAQSSDNTRAAYRSDLDAFVAWCEQERTDPLAATPADLDRYRDDRLRAGASAATVTRRLAGLASFFRYAAEAGALGENPADGVDRPVSDGARREALDGDEVAELLAAAESIGSKSAALIGLLALDGMKLGEVLAIDVPSIHIRPGSVAVTVERRGETGTLTLSDRSASAVVSHRADRRRGPLFVGDSPVARRPKRLTRFGADFLIKRAASAAGIEKPVSAGVLRRSYIGAAHRAGTPIAEIASQVGHKEVRATARLLDGQT